jgi:hypothetical protein
MGCEKRCDKEEGCRRKTGRPAQWRERGPQADHSKRKLPKKNDDWIKPHNAKEAERQLAVSLKRNR